MEVDNNDEPPDKRNKIDTNNGKNSNERTSEEVINELKNTVAILSKRIRQMEKIISENGLQIPDDNEINRQGMDENISYADIMRTRGTHVVHNSGYYNNNPNTQTTSSQVVNNNASNDHKAIHSRNSAIPPIIVEDEGNRKEIWNEVKKITDKITFIPINSKRYRICVTDSLENYNKILNYIKNSGAKGNTYTPKDLKPISLIVRNLEYVDSLDEQTIKDEYAKFGFTVQKAVHWSTKRMANNNKFFWFIQFNPNTDMTKLKNKTLIFNVSVRYEKPMNKLEIMQCRKCKRFEHAQSSCFNEYRCIKCPHTHERGKCELPDASKPFCCNCGRDGHPANSPNCPIYLNLVQRRKGNNNQRQTTTNKDENGYITVGRNGKPIAQTKPVTQTSQPFPIPSSQRMNTSLMTRANEPINRRTGQRQFTNSQQHTHKNSESTRLERVESNLYSIMIALEQLTNGQISLKGNNYGSR